MEAVRSTTWGSIASMPLGTVSGLKPILVIGFSARHTGERFERVEPDDVRGNAFSRKRGSRHSRAVLARPMSAGYNLIGTKGALTAEPAYDYSMVFKHRITIEEKDKDQNLPRSATTSPHKSLTFRIVFYATESPNDPDGKGSRTFESFAQFMNRQTPGGRLGSPTFR